MSDIKACVAKNIAGLRQAKGMTQLELAEQLNYSDKAVSKWERAESMPDISVLVEIADLFGVSLDYLVQEEHPKKEEKQEEGGSPYRRGMISAVSILLVWFIAVFVFVVISIMIKEMRFQWLSFIYAIPVSMIVWIVFNTIWFRPRLNYVLISLLMWSALLSIHLSILAIGSNIWMIYLLGIPGQIIILLWSTIKKQH